ncbi:hypothetical protein GOP47_0012245 [Adiantum capillus-veneris]|uniref:EGF-like domain-containing protein n=1 Tax=Adiantum capillus-veneris TaxID=13818 RepID=A0A9D4UQB5_ADICA|nr:hypothetical protein GOP47_0012245 [Adiantum capillus-veneris]
MTSFIPQAYTQRGFCGIIDCVNGNCSSIEEPPFYTCSCEPGWASPLNLSYMPCVAPECLGFSSCRANPSPLPSIFGPPLGFTLHFNGELEGNCNTSGIPFEGLNPQTSTSPYQDNSLNCGGLENFGMQLHLIIVASLGTLLFFVNLKEREKKGQPPPKKDVIDWIVDEEQQKVSTRDGKKVYSVLDTVHVHIQIVEPHPNRTKLELTLFT